MKDKTNSPQNTIRYPKDLARIETINRIETKNNSAEIIERSAFELSGGFPFLFDVISCACTYHKDFIKDDPQETHYNIKIPREAFDDFAFDNFTDHSRDILKKEIWRVLRNPDRKILPLDNRHTILTEPIRLDIVYERDVLYSSLVSRNKKGEYTTAPRLKIKGYIIYFYKPLFSRLLSGQYGKAWFPLPKAFQAKMIHEIKEKGNDPIFKGYGNFGHVTNYRKLYLYLNLHDNSRSNELHYDALDMTARCLSGNISIKNGKPYLDNWYTSHQFIQKGLKLFHLMAQDGLMEGVKLIPGSVFYEKPIKKFRVKIIRPDNVESLPSFLDETPFLPDGTRKDDE